MQDINREIIFHIIHGSFVDGYGVRTTVFLKGCPLRCIWCCNPEGQRVNAEIKLTPSKCNACGNCLDVCAPEAITINREQEDDKVQIDRELCTNCGKCVDLCYTGALEYFGKLMSVDEVFDLVIKDESFYNMSGGGVTIGGGEPTFVPSFTYALIKKCQANYIHTAVDTSGYTVNEEGFKVLQEADLLLYDLKGMDDEEHIKNTGVSNKRILENLRKLADMGKPIIIRMPILPGYNDSEQNIQHAAEFLSNLKSIERVDILPYHNYGSVKYRQLSRICMIDVETPSQEHITNIQDILEDHGLRTQIGG